jgi:hypothetical protein
VHYFIDGYNVTKQDPSTRDLELEDQREALETRMNVRGSALLGKGDYTIIWDGAGGVGVSDRIGVAKASHSRYTRRPSADDAIVETVRCAKQQVGVVTSDHELARRCQAVAPQGVTILPATRLFEAAQPAHSATGKTPRTLSRNVGIPPQAAAINKELKELWGIED